MFASIACACGRACYPVCVCVLLKSVHPEMLQGPCPSCIMLHRYLRPQPAEPAELPPKAEIEGRYKLDRSYGLTHLNSFESCIIIEFSMAEWTAVTE